MREGGFDFAPLEDYGDALSPLPSRPPTAAAADGDDDGGGGGGGEGGATRDHALRVFQQCVAATGALVDGRGDEWADAPRAALVDVTASAGAWARAVGLLALASIASPAESCYRLVPPSPRQ